jgi:hypothetical protein
VRLSIVALAALDAKSTEEPMFNCCAPRPSRSLCMTHVDRLTGSGIVENNMIHLYQHNYHQPPGWHNWLARETFKSLEISRFRVQASGWANFFLSFSRYIPRCLPHSSSRSFFSCIPAHLAGAIFCSCSIPVAIDVIGQTCWF